MSQRQTPTPLLSVVIPTCNRPQFLPRAIASALQAAPDGDVEVIVVPNGPDESWKVVAEAFKQDQRVQWHPIAKAHACTARNRGMMLARGKYLRFLDDDDYLLPAAREQIHIIESQCAEVCSCLIESIDINGGSLGVLRFPETRDFVSAVLTQSSFGLPTGNVFLRQRCASVKWDESAPRLQDLRWMLDLAKFREWKWAHLNKVCGVWFQHPDSRISTTIKGAISPKPVIDSILELHATLIEEKRNTEDRDFLAAGLLWNYINMLFPYSPLYWHKIAKKAKNIHPRSRPTHRLFESRWIRQLDPLLLEWLMLPPRVISNRISDIKKTYGGGEYKRTL